MSVTPKPGAVKRNRLILEWVHYLLLIVVLIATALLLPNGDDPDESLHQQAQAACYRAPDTPARLACQHAYIATHEGDTP